MKKVTLPTLKDKRLEANDRAQYWLGQANLAIESGKPAYVIDECERKAQYWLDRLNKFERLTN
jgi:hypothetical protein